MSDARKTQRMHTPPFRVGIGYDVHALVPGRPCVIGGVVIPAPFGLKGHSDADVLAHAITDAVLGAAALGDIGALFPDDDPRWQGADSIMLLTEAWRRVAASGWQLANLDAVVIGERPKILPYVATMKARLAAALDCLPEQIQIKGKTHEKLGALGRGEGIAAHAVVLLWQMP
ncbi:2-C-methyl-D-erythritol 2,4-cyclodiphosphate synthase [Hydrogenophilus thiooxidans]|uniref:2-C-methyl-D-erythritol 2,4-cyclodiphosphate synthase n=1 Tax=Hydrogenophilus thiooxidans TaxID=2820326 RepID=UPI0020175BE9|nr:2-C-methyl-D-erythritol 2,4-cyclodiphosphate synthase [Hydrogenophilus thiooxidans]